MKTKIETIKPQYALEVLEKKNPRNRTLSEGTVQAYATDMKNGRWVTTHQGIAFDENGNLIDGQHRLWAVVFSNCEVEFNVTRDVPMSAIKNGLEVFTMDTIDRNRPRTVGQQLQLCHGIVNSNVVASACRAIADLIYPGRSSARMSTSNTLLIYEVWGNDIQDLSKKLDKRFLKGSVLGPIAMYHHGECARALEFCHQIKTLEDLESASRALVRYLNQHYGRGKSDAIGRVTAQSLLNFHKKKTVDRASDNTTGREWLISMFPSKTKQIREALRPCEVKGTLVMNRMVLKHEATKATAS